MDPAFALPSPACSVLPGLLSVDLDVRNVADGLTSPCISATTAYMYGDLLANFPA